MRFEVSNIRQQLFAMQLVLNFQLIAVRLTKASHRKRLTNPSHVDIELNQFLAIDLVLGKQFDVHFQPQASQPLTDVQYLEWHDSNE